MCKLKKILSFMNAHTVMGFHKSEKHFDVYSQAWSWDGSAMCDAQTGMKLEAFTLQEKEDKSVP